MRLLKTCLISFLLLLPVAVACAAEQSVATVTGKVATKSGAPMAEAFVYLFNDTLGPPPMPNKYWRLPDEIVLADQSGQFTAQIPYGTYYIGAIKRINGSDVGPPVAGDIFMNSSTDAGIARKFIINKAQINVGVIDQGEPLLSASVAKLDGITGIEGKVVNADGKPAPGVSVFAFLSPNMVGRPQFASDLTDPDGKFLLRVAKGGNYFLKAREGYGGGPPKLGGLIGIYGDQEALPVITRQGEIIKGIRLVVAPFAGQGAKQGTGQVTGQPQGKPLQKPGTTDK